MRGESHVVGVRFTSSEKRNGKIIEACWPAIFQETLEYQAY